MLTGKVIGKLNFSASIYRSLYSPAPSFYRSLFSPATSFSTSSLLNTGVSASYLAAEFTSSDYKAETSTMMLRRGLNSSLSIYRSFYSPAPSFSTSSPLNTGVSASALAADFTSSAYKAETSPMMLRRGLNSSLSIYQYRSSFSSSTPVNAAAAELTVDDTLIDDDMIAKAYKTVTTQKVLQPGVIVYDGVCHLCHNGVKWVIKADKYRNLKFCCLQSKAAEPYMDLCGVDRDDVLRRFIFIEGFGLYHQGSAAALRVLAHLPFPYSALSNLMIIPAPLRDAVYDHVAKKRYNWFGKSNDCLVLREQELLARFIDREELLERSRRVL